MANGNSGYLNDLWEFNPAHQRMVWMSGSNTVGSHGGQPGVYGALALPAAGNTPGGRNGSAVGPTAAGISGSLGLDVRCNSIAGELNDLWEFNPSINEWAWNRRKQHGGPHDGQSGIYGTLGTPAAGNTPVASMPLPVGPMPAALSGSLEDRATMPTTILPNSTAFGSSILPRANGHGWRKQNGRQQWCPAGVYGTLGTPATGNIPETAATLQTGPTAAAISGSLEEMATMPAEMRLPQRPLGVQSCSDEWAWMSGSSTVGDNGSQSGVYGTLGTLAAGNTPEAAVALQTGPTATAISGSLGAMAPMPSAMSATSAMCGSSIPPRMIGRGWAEAALSAAMADSPECTALWVHRLLATFLVAAMPPTVGQMAAAISGSLGAMATMQPQLWASQ